MLHFEKAGNFKSVSLWYFYNTIDCRQKFGKIIDENKGLYPCHIISMRDMVYCLSHNIDPLSQIGDHYIISREKDYMTTKNNPEMAKVLMDRFMQGNTSYLGIETNKGVLLFSNYGKGEQQSEQFLQNLANDFYHPYFGYNKLVLHTINTWPSLTEGKVDLCYKELLLENNEDIPDNAFVSDDILNYSCKEIEFDLTPTWRNFNRLIEENPYSPLQVSPENYEIMTLQCFADPPATPAESVVDYSKFVTDFSRAYEFLEVINQCEESGKNFDNELQKLARKIIKKEYADNPRLNIYNNPVVSVKEQPKRVVENLSMKNKGKRMKL